MITKIPKCSCSACKLLYNKVSTLSCWSKCSCLTKSYCLSKCTCLQKCNCVAKCNNCATKCTFKGTRLEGWNYTYHPFKLFFELYILLLVTSFLAYATSNVDSFGFGLIIIMSTLIFIICLIILPIGSVVILHPKYYNDL